MAQVRIFKHYVHMPYVLLALLESAIFVGAIFIAIYLRFFLGQPLSAVDLELWLPSALLFTLVMLIAMMALGTYESRLAEGVTGMMLRTVISMLLGIVALSFIYYLLSAEFIYLGRGVLALATIFAFFSLTIFRLIFFRSVDDDAFKKRILVFGAGKRAANILDRLRSASDQRGFKIIGFIAVESEEVQVSPDQRVQLSGSIFAYAEANEVDEIVVAPDDRRQKLPLDDLLDCKLNSIDVVDILTFFEREARKIELDLLNPSWIIFSDGFARGPLAGWAERLFDLLASGLLLLFTWPFMLITAIAIKLEEGWSAPLLYKQKRVGLNGEPFSVMKFRSMRQDAEKHGAVWAKKNDSRVTRVGAFIRKYRVDELPQILNVFRGDMSFVGPRPERPEFVEQLGKKIPYYHERHRVKPGITGWAQLCYPYGASDEDAAHKLEYDLYYLKNHSLMLDIIILINTVEVVLYNKGAR